MQRIKCYQCFRPQDLCFCHYKDKVSTPFELVILIHPKEAYKQKVGTGRLSKVLVQKAKLLIDVDFTENEQLNEILATTDAHLLYPGTNTLSPLDFKQAAISKPSSLIVIDGTWPCAKKMMKLSQNLHQLPRVSFNGKYKSNFKFKHQPQDFCLSTIESIYHTLNEGEMSEGSEHMMKAFNELVQLQVDFAKLPGNHGYRRRGPVKEAKDRNFSKKWETRSLIYNDV